MLLQVTVVALGSIEINQTTRESHRQNINPPSLLLPPPPPPTASLHSPTPPVPTFRLRFIFNLISQKFEKIFHDFFAKYVILQNPLPTVSCVAFWGDISTADHSELPSRCSPMFYACQ